MNIIINIKSKIANIFLNEDNRFIFALFFPILIEQLILTMMSVIHAVMLANVGKEAISAISLVDQLNQFAYAILGSVSLGATIVISQYIGSHKSLSAKATAEQAVTLGFLVAVIVGAVFLFFADQIFVIFFKKDQIDPQVFDYAMTYMSATAVSFPMFSLTAVAAGIIRGTGNAKTPMVISITMGLINAVTAWFCIFVLDLEVYGAGVAICISRCAGGIIAFILLIRKGYIRKIKNLFIIRIKYIFQILRIGIYSGAENMIFQLGRTLTQSFYISGGTNHVAANGIGTNMFGVLCAPGNSMSIVATTLIGRLTGAGDKKRSYIVLRNIVILSSFMLLAIHFIYMPLSPLMLGLYTKDADVISLINRILLLNFIFMPLSWSSSFVLVAGMKGAGDARYSTVMSIVSMWLVRVLCGYIFGQVLKMGVVGVWLAMFLDWVFRSGLAVFRFLSKKWQNKSVI